MLADEDPGTRRNRNEGGLWLINLLVAALVAVLSLYVFRTEDARRDARTMIAAPPAMVTPLTPPTG